MGCAQSADHGTHQFALFIPKMHSCRGLLELRQKLADASRADDDTVARRCRKPIDVIILDSAAAYVARFTVAERGDHSFSQDWTAAWRCDRGRGGDSQE